MTDHTVQTDYSGDDHADCEQTLRDVETFLDGELSPEQFRDVLGHLDRCMDCYQAFDFQAELKQVIARKCGGDALPPGLLERITRSLAQPGEGRWAARRRPGSRRR